MSAGEIAALIASVLAIGVGVLAISLSIVFFRMSSHLSEATHGAAKDISAGVGRLEKLFDTFYGDTFSMMKDTYSDMRKQLWPTQTDTEDKTAQEAEKRADAKLQDIKAQFADQVERLIERQTRTDDKIEDVRHDVRQKLQPLVDTAITESRKVDVEARGETLRQLIQQRIKTLRRRRKTVEADNIVLFIQDGSVFQISQILRELEKMKKEGILFWEGDELQRDTVIEVSP